MAREEEEPCSLVEFRLNVEISRKIKGTERERGERGTSGLPVCAER